VKTSRQKLLDYVKVKQVVTVAEISQALKMTKANARHHLSILLELGLVTFVGQRMAGRRGRPANLYRLSETVLGENYALLSRALLDEVMSGLPVPDRLPVMRRIVFRWLKETGMLQGEKGPLADLVEIDGKTPLPSGLTKRLVNAIHILNTLNYQAHWEAHAEAPEIILRHCPYAAILPQHPELCLLDAELLALLTQLPVSQVAKLARDITGATYCTFSIGGQRRNNRRS
jgi:predicted ArsR family transcriptional regulator